MSFLFTVFTLQDEYGICPVRSRGFDGRFYFEPLHIQDSGNCAALPLEAAHLAMLAFHEPIYTCIYIYIMRQMTKSQYNPDNARLS